MQYITLHYITLHYITYMSYIYIYIHTYIHKDRQTDRQTHTHTHTRTHTGVRDLRRKRGDVVTVVSESLPITIIQCYVLFMSEKIQVCAHVRVSVGIHVRCHLPMHACMHARTHARTRACIHNVLPHCCQRRYTIYLWYSERNTHTDTHTGSTHVA